MKDFEYRKPSTLPEVFQLMEERGERARMMAGGTDLLVKMKNQTLAPRVLIDLKGIPDMNGIHYHPESGLRIGALTTIHRLETSALLQEKFGVLVQAASSLGSYQIRSRATLGGNLCNASPAADMIPGLIILGAKAEIAGPGGNRCLPVEGLFAGPGRTKLRPGEILTEIQIPHPNAPAGFSYAKHTIRKAMDLAVVGVAVAFLFDQSRETCLDVKIALGAVGPIPFRATGAETCLRGQGVDDDLISYAALLASKEAQPISDIRASGEYRREMVRVLAHRTLKEAWINLLEGRNPACATASRFS